MTVTKAELRLLRVMAEKDIDWTWIILDRTLAVKGIPGFSNVANIVTSLVNNGMVDIVYSEENAKPRYRVSVQGHQFLSKKKVE
ncbi:MarR family transcriptional regulator [Pseudescherichia sp.]|uniref:MarR family transcriptional regulator n=1 Tax=Pseudescherichia sp. TaxID=2055881 RepID=UPI00289A43D5|nr:MarR family transcriptional regulator [Pseudescherichia sp.]